MSSDSQQSCESSCPNANNSATGINNIMNGHTSRPADATNVSLRGRLSHLTWAWFTFPQSQGGIAIVLAMTPHRFNGLTTIGTIVFLFNVVVFLALSIAMTARFVMFPDKLKKSFVHPPECYYFPSFFLSIATIIACMQLYGVPHCGPWLPVAIRVLFWIYAATTLSVSIAGYTAFAANTPIQAVTTNPVPWLFTILCSMLTGTVASVIADAQPPEQRLPIIIAGLAYQGLGFLVAFIIIAMYFYHLLQQGLPPPDQRPGMFMPIGAGGYTMVALIGLAKALPADYGYFSAHPTAKEILQVLALFVSVFLWLFTFWMFALGVVGNLLCVRKMGFKLAWWALIFPNVGFALGTIDIGTELESPAILWVSTAMTLLLVVFWLLDLGLTAKAVFTKRIMWPGEDEDKEA